MNYLILKSLHIISIVTWFAGLFYMPRLLIYFAEAAQKNEVEKNILQEQFKIMQRRLWWGITTPSAIAVLILGGSLLQYFPLQQNAWLIVKLFFVAGLYFYHFYLQRIFQEQQKSIISVSPTALRVINEVATLFLFAIVFLVVLKSVMNMIYGIVALFIFILILIFAIKIYKNIREKNEARNL